MRTPRTSRVIRCLASLALFFISASAQAEFITAVESFDYNTFNRLSTAQLPGTTFGWQFSTNSQITVRRLGVLDIDNSRFVFNNLQDDLRSSHEVGIFTATGNLLVTGVVQPGAPLDGIFRYTDVAPTILSAGETYIIGAFYVPFDNGGDLLLEDVRNLQASPDIIFGGGRIRTSDFFGFPNDIVGRNRYFGPNFQGDAAATVPDPTTFGLAAIGFDGLFWFRSGRWWNLRGGRMCSRLRPFCWNSEGRRF
jgi:hypothetical protein